MEFGRPTILIVPRDEDIVLVTPNIELEMARQMTTIRDIRAWQDGVGEEWRGPLKQILARKSYARIGLEVRSLPPVIREHIDRELPAAGVTDIAVVIAGMR
jgi:hypothetical protein